MVQRSDFNVVTKLERKILGITLMKSPEFKRVTLKSYISSVRSVDVVRSVEKPITDFQAVKTVCSKRPFFRLAIEINAEFASGKCMRLCGFGDGIL
nr:hypothetical protein [Candidatus Njordarchaeota archaeon]